MVTTRKSSVKEQLTWCKKEIKSIKFVTPSANVVRAQIAQASEDIQAMDVMRNANIVTWATNSSYYANYHAVSALF